MLSSPLQVPVFHVPCLLFISILPATPSIARTSTAVSIIIIACSSESPHISPLIIPLFLSSIFDYPLWSWIIPSSLLHLSLLLPFLSSPLLSPACLSFLSLLNPDAVFLLKRWRINHKKSINPMWGDLFFWHPLHCIKCRVTFLYRLFSFCVQTRHFTMKEPICFFFVFILFWFCFGVTERKKLSEQKSPLCSQKCQITAANMV